MSEGFNPRPDEEPDFESLAGDEDTVWDEERKHARLPEEMRPINEDDPDKARLAITPPTAIRKKDRGKNDPDETGNNT